MTSTSILPINFLNALAIAFGLFSLSSCSPPNSQTVFVQAGNPIQVIESFDQWHRDSGYLEGQRRNNMLFADALLEDADFDLHVALSMHQTDQLPALFIEIAANHFWLDLGRVNPSCFLRGPIVPDTAVFPQTLDQGDLGRKLHIYFQRKGSHLTCRLNDSLVGTISINTPLGGKLGIYPARGKIRVYDFHLSGQAFPMPAPPIFTEVFHRGEFGYNSFRIPALISLPNGDVLVFCEGRKSGQRDRGAIDLVMKRSRDSGATWRDFQVISSLIDTPYVEAKNPCLIYDHTHNHLHLFFSLNDEKLVQTVSKDQGLSWETPQYVTAVSGRPLFPGYELYAGPGKGVLLTKGPHKGRILLPSWIKHKKEKLDRMYTVVLYSDDQGQSWEGNMVVDSSLRTSNECTVVELSNGKLLLNIRTQDKSRRLRGLSFSENGGDSWSETIFHPTLVGPICHASSLYDSTKGQILFCNPANPLPHHRNRLTLRRSLNEGKTWTDEVLIYEGPSAYSDMTILPSGKLGIIFEHGIHYSYERITLRCYELEQIGY